MMMMMTMKTCFFLLLQYGCQFQGRTQGMEAAGLETPSKSKFQSVDFVQTMIPNVLRDLYFRRNQTEIS
jgi:hypothetical protein